MEKWFEFYWKDGKISYSKGKTEADALTKAGFSIGVLQALNFAKESQNLPLNEKEIKFIYADGTETILNKHTLFCEKAMQKITEETQKIEIRIGTHIWKCIVEIKPFEIILTEYI